MAINNREGYLSIDHRNSPGLTPEQAIRAGFDPKNCGAGGHYETAVYTCAHCSGTVVKEPLRMRPRERCLKCSGRTICDACYLLSTAPDYIHRSLEARIDDALRESSRQSIFL